MGCPLNISNLKIKRSLEFDYNHFSHVILKYYIFFSICINQ